MPGRLQSSAVGAALGAAALVLARCSVFVSTDGLGGGATGVDDAGERADVTAPPDAGRGPVDAGCGDALADDPKNCGACGHDCLGGRCVSGACEAVVLARGVTSPGYVALDRDHVYWATWEDVGGVHRVPRAGGAVAPVAAPQTGTFALAVDETHVYFSTSSGVKRVPKGGGAVSLLGPGDSADIVFDGANVVYSVYREGDAGGAVRSVPRGGGSVTTVSSGISGAEGLAIDDRFIYVAQEQGAAILELPRGGGVPRGLSAAYARRIAIDADFVYYATYSSAAIRRVGRASGAVAEVATSTSPSRAANMVLDGDTIYWTAAGAPSRLFRVAKTGGSAVEIASGTELIGLAVDERAICWSDKRAGTISCLAK
ncbi:MAG: hypothetical protein JNL38_08155 [Myxococcales bacterium]|nr:hypothetical protein [Myxococcales bacterium]